MIPAHRRYTWECIPCGCQDETATLDPPKCWGCKPARTMELRKDGWA